MISRGQILRTGDQSLSHTRYLIIFAQFTPLILHSRRALQMVLSPRTRAFSCRSPEIRQGVKYALTIFGRWLHSSSLVRLMINLVIFIHAWARVTTFVQNNQRLCHGTTNQARTSNTFNDGYACVTIVFDIAVTSRMSLKPSITRNNQVTTVNNIIEIRVYKFSKPECWILRTLRYPYLVSHASIN